MGRQCSMQSPARVNRRMVRRMSAVVTAALLLTSCSGHNGDDVREEASASPGSKEQADARQSESHNDWDALYEEQLLAEAKGLGFDEVPDDAQLIRFIRPDEFAETRIQCMEEQGFGASLARDGGVEYARVPPEQADSQRWAALRCAAMYAVHPRYHQPHTEEQQRITYEYFTQQLIPCLAAEGYEVGEVPTWESYRAMESLEGWEPYKAAGISDAIGLTMTEDEWFDITERCPPGPPIEALFGAG